jgi:nitrate reductase gamma subunit
MEYVMGMVLPYVALSVFLVGMLFRIAGWLRTPVPFHLTRFRCRIIRYLSVISCC